MFVAAASSATDAVISGPLLVAIVISAAAGLVSFFLALLPAPRPRLPFLRGGTQRRRQLHYRPAVAR